MSARAGAWSLRRACAPALDENRAPLPSAPRAEPRPGPPPVGVKELGSGPSYLESDDAMRAIFISYRRDDAEGHAGRLFQDLCESFGKDAVFMDVSGIEPGLDFRRAIDQQISSCGVLLAVIGKNWLNATDAAGRRRLDDPQDFVRLETATALRRGIPVVPVLVHEAQMPQADQLPEDLKDLAFRNAVELSHTRWDSDVELLVRALRRHVDEPGSARATAAAPAAAERPAATAPPQPNVAVAAPPPAESNGSASASHGWRWPVVLAALVVGGAAVGYIAWQRSQEAARADAEANRLAVEKAQAEARAASEAAARAQAEADAAAAREQVARAKEEAARRDQAARAVAAASAPEPQPAARQPGRSAAPSGPNAIGAFAFDPPPDSVLAPGQPVRVSFDYRTTEAEGVRIWVEPLVGGMPPPNTSWGGSPRLAAGSGKHSSGFTVRAADVGVDGVKVFMKSATRPERLFETILPVHYQFRADPRAPRVPIGPVPKIVKAACTLVGGGVYRLDLYGAAEGGDNVTVSVGSDGALPRDPASPGAIECGAWRMSGPNACTRDPGQPSGTRWRLRRDAAFVLLPGSAWAVMHLTRPDGSTQRLGEQRVEIDCH